MTTSAAPQLTWLPVEITARSPLAFPERKPGTQFRASLPFVPGATIYGALGRLLHHANLGEPVIRAAIAGLRCHNAYPVHPTDPWSRPLPLTALQAKGEPKAPVIDGLVQRVCWEIQEPPALLFLPTDTDGRPWERPGWEFYTLHNGKLVERSVTQRVLTRVAINRRRGTAEDQRLYSPLVINEARFDPQRETVTPTVFRGSLSLPANNPAIPLIDRIDALGGRVSTGLGAVEVRSGNAVTAAPDSPAQILDRIERLTARFRAQAARYTRLGGRPFTVAGVPADQLTFFTVNLLADTILLEEGWFPTVELSAAMLLAATGITTHLVRAFTRPTLAGGWNIKWQRPKPTQAAVTMGSLYLFATNQIIDLPVAQRLYALELDGIGERRPEGYGQVRICDEFHLSDPAGAGQGGRDADT